jgi:hypothetical protein
MTQAHPRGAFSKWCGKGLRLHSSMDTAFIYLYIPLPWAFPYITRPPLVHSVPDKLDSKGSVGRKREREKDREGGGSSFSPIVESNMSSLL